MKATHQHIYLAVFPFQTFTADPRVDMLCQGLVMDIITDLARFRSFQIIAHNSVKQILLDGELDQEAVDALRLDYLVKGMVRSNGDDLQLNIQLVTAQNGRLVWAERFKGRLDDLFQIQEDVVEKIVVSLQHFVDYDLLTEIRKKSMTRLGAYECWLRGYQELKKSTVEADGRARDFFQQAMEIDKNYARAYTGMSLSYFNEWSCQLWSRWEVNKHGAFEWAQKALEIDEWDHVSNAIIGRIYLFNGEYEKSEHYLRRSLRINPNDAEMLILIAMSFVYLGYNDEALKLYERARRLNPADAFMLHACGAFVQFERGAINKAIELGECHEMGTGWVDFPAYQAAAYFLKGDLESMQHYWQLFLDDFSIKINAGKPADTKTAVQWMRDINPYREDTRLESFWNYMLGEGVELPKSSVPSRIPSSENTLCWDGERWRIHFNGTEALIPDLKGIHDLSRLLSQPHAPVHCTDLMGAVMIASGEQMFDEKAKAAYRDRMLNLQEQIDEAEERADADQLAALQEEYDQLLDHLSGAIGKRGKTRRAGGTIEKCRAAVTWRIRSAIKKIEETHSPLGRHLKAAVKTGTFCEYNPERETAWVIHQPA